MRRVPAVRRDGQESPIFAEADIGPEFARDSRRERYGAGEALRRQSARKVPTLPSQIV